MSLDIHISKGQNTAASTERELFFDENLHDIIFEKISILDPYPQFKRLEDYYKDTTYCDLQIEQLNKELQEIILNTSYEPLKLFAISFKKVCEKSISQGDNVYCFSD